MSYDPTLIPIARTVLASTATTITFSSIPATYSHLYLSLVGRGDTAATSVTVNITVNGDVTSSYTGVTAWCSAAGTLTSLANAQGTTAPVGILAAGSSPAGYGGCIELWICHYTETTFNQPVEGQNMASIATAAGNAQMRTVSVVWAGTAAVTSIALAASAGNFVAGTTALLYGQD